jgi:drug/metabolite transporter (DMT)-like permease
VLQTPSDPSLKLQRSEGVPTLLMGFFLLGLQPMFVKLASRYGFSAAESVLIRFAITLGFAVGSAVWLGQSLRTRQPWIWLLRGVLGGGAVLLYFTAVELSGAGTGTLLNYTYPVWSQLFSFTIGERLRLESLAYLALALLGVYLVVSPGSASFGVGEISGIASGILAGGGVLCLKKLRQTDGEQTIIVSFSLVGIAYALLLMFLQRGPSFSAARPIEGWLVELAVGLLSFWGHMYFTKGYKHTTIRLGSLLSLLVPLIAAATGFVFLGERVTLNFVLGAALILGSVLLATWRERPRLQYS